MSKSALKEQYAKWKHRSILAREDFVGTFECTDEDDSVIVGDAADGEEDIENFAQV